MSTYLFVINSLAGGGAERVFSSILNTSAGHDEGRKLHVALLDDEPRRFELAHEIEVHDLDTAGSLPKGVSRLTALIRKLKPDVVVSFLTRANVAAVAAGRLTQTPVVISERVSTRAHLSLRPSALASRALVHLAYPRADAIIAVSREISSEMVQTFGAKPDRVHTIYNPVDAKRIRKLASETDAVELGIAKPYLMGMGRLVPAKNFELLIRALARSKSRFNLLIAGQGPDHDTLKALANSLQVSNRVTFASFLPNPFPTLASASAFVLPSRVEGFPNALVEAMSLGVPCIAANCPTGPAEILAGQMRVEVNDYRVTSSGIIFDLDDVDQLVRAIDCLEEDQTLANDLRQGALSRVTDFDPDLTIDRYWEIITEVARS